MIFQPGCPWYDLHSQFPPNVDWCEEKVCSLIVTPYNAWTNLAYLFFGLLMWNRSKNTSNDILKFFGKASIIVGISSFLYHMSLNAFTQVFDFFGMYLFTMIVIMSNQTRAKKWPNGKNAFKRFWYLVGGLTFSTVIALSFHFPIQLFIGVLILLIIWTEFNQKTNNRKFFWISLVMMFVGAILSAMDVSRLLCWPENHFFQAHGTWHLITAWALYFAYRHAEEAARR